VAKLLGIAMVNPIAQLAGLWLKHFKIDSANGCVVMKDSDQFRNAYIIDPQNVIIYGNHDLTAGHLHADISGRRSQVSLSANIRELPIIRLHDQLSLVAGVIINHNQLKRFVFDF
jgi:hypothetical protein